jgi:hypothetical protein
MRLFVSVFLFGTAGIVASGYAFEQDNLAFDIPADRFDLKHARVQEDERQRVRIFEVVPRGQTVENWTELVTMQSSARKKHPAPRQAVDETKVKLAARCPGVVWNEIEAKRDDILYEWRITGCGTEPDQQEIARYLASKSTVFRIAYSVKGKQMSDADRQQWISRLRAAKLEK